MQENPILFQTDLIGCKAVNWYQLKCFKMSLGIIYDYKDLKPATSDITRLIM
jgi:hypothetical protein